MVQNIRLSKLIIRNKQPLQRLSK